MYINVGIWYIINEQLYIRKILSLLKYKKKKKQSFKVSSIQISHIYNIQNIIIIIHPAYLNPFCFYTTKKVFFFFWNPVYIICAV